MTNDEQFDDRYVRFREHADVRERVTALEGHQTQQMALLQDIKMMLAARPTVPTQPPETAAALALHRALDAYDKRPQGSGATNILAYVGMLAIGAVGSWLLLGLNL